MKNIILRYKARSALKRRVDLQYARYIASLLEVNSEHRTEHMTQGEVVCWKRWLDNYQELLLLKKEERSQTLFWVLTGRKINIYDKILRVLRISGRPKDSSLYL